MHHQEVGLWATRQLSQLLFPFQIQAIVLAAKKIIHKKQGI